MGQFSWSIGVEYWSAVLEYWVLHKSAVLEQWVGGPEYSTGVLYWGTVLDHSNGAPYCSVAVLGYSIGVLE